MAAISKQPLSRYIKIVLLLAIGYAPLLPDLYFFTDIDWAGLYGNEAVAWMIILSIFDILAVISAVRIFRAAPIFAVISILAALLPLALGWLSWIINGLGPSSKEDQNPSHGMIDFWIYGGGEEVVLFVLLPLVLWYFYLRFRERKAGRPLAHA